MTDIFTLVIPIAILYRLKIARSCKIAVVVILSLGWV